jgi:glycerate 2-kinase
MRILVAPTAYKGSLSPFQVAEAISDGITEFAGLPAQSNLYSNIYIDRLPLADGGDGTVEALAQSCGGSLKRLEVAGSLGEAREALWLNLDSYAVVELASACGIAGLGRESLRPLAANSLGLGTVLKHVIETTNITDIVVALGGSASTDGGSAALYELGARFFDAPGRQFVPAGGGSLLQLSRCDLTPARLKLRGRKLMVVTDVDNPLLGPDGAAHVFGPQKGASPEDVALLDRALAHYAELIEDDANLRLQYLKGAGAAGGAAFGLAALGATITSGFDWLARALKLDEHLSNCDLVMSGEGRTDSSSFLGKVVGSLHKLCLQHNKPLWVFSGSVADDLEISPAPPELVQGLVAGGQKADAAQIKQAVCDALRQRCRI